MLVTTENGLTRAKHTLPARLVVGTARETPESDHSMLLLGQCLT